MQKTTNLDDTGKNLKIQKTEYKRFKVGCTVKPKTLQKKAQKKEDGSRF